MSKLWMTVAGFFGLSALILDAFGSHALRIEKAIQSWQIATRYQLIHAVLLVSFAMLAAKKGHWTTTLGAVAVTMGMMLFCGGIYLKSATGIAAFGQITPYGGICLMAAWIFVAASAWQKKH